MGYCYCVVTSVAGRARDKVEGKENMDGWIGRVPNFLMQWFKFHSYPLWRLMANCVMKWNLSGLHYVIIGLRRKDDL